MKQTRMRLLREVTVKTLPVLAGYMVLGIGFGILMKVNGYGLIWTFLMSVFIYAGSMQYVAVALLTSGASLAMAALTTLMVNARHLFYGISMIDRYKGASLRKAYLVLTLTDETYSLVSTGSEPDWADPTDYYFLVSLCNQLYWVVGSVLGALLGALIRFDTAGIDFAMTAFFVTIFVEQWLSNAEHRPALIGVGASLICLLVFGRDDFLIPAMVAIIALLTLCRNPLERGGEHHA